MWPLALLACTQGPADSAVPVDPLTADALGAATLAMTSLGARMVTTPAEELARAEVERLFLEAGLVDVRSEPFTWDAWVPGTASVTVGAETFPAEAFSPSPRTDGALLELAASDVSGKAALFFASQGSRSEQFATARARGAAAMIRVHDLVEPDGAHLVEVGHTLDGSTLPSVAVSADAGPALIAALGATVRLDIAADVARGHVSHNVLGAVRGRSDDTVYVTAHYDSWHPSESAFDNGLGVGAMVLLARKLAQGPQPEKTVVFLATSGEEQGLQGANAWTAQNDAAARDAEFVLNLDVVWAGAGSYWIAATEERWRTFAMDAAQSEGIEDVRDAGYPGIASDHVPFMTRGVPGMWNSRWPDRHYHTSRDTLDQMDMDEALGAVRLHWRVLAEVAGAEP